MKDLNFTLTRKEEPVTIDEDKYVLTELNGTERDKYLGTLARRVQPGRGNGPAGVRNFDGLQANLITMTLRQIVDGEREAVDIKTIQTWPARVVNDLFNAAQELSGLADDKDKVGND